MHEIHQAVVSFVTDQFMLLPSNF